MLRPGVAGVQYWCKFTALCKLLNSCSYSLVKISFFYYSKYFILRNQALYRELNFMWTIFQLVVLRISLQRSAKFVNLTSRYYYVRFMLSMFRGIHNTIHFLVWEDKHFHITISRNTALNSTLFVIPSVVHLKMHIWFSIPSVVHLKCAFGKGLNYWIMRNRFNFQFVWPMQVHGKPQGWQNPH